MTGTEIPVDLAAGIRAWIADIVRTELKVLRGVPFGTADRSVET